MVLKLAPTLHWSIDTVHNLKYYLDAEIKGSNCTVMESYTIWLNRV